MDFFADVLQKFEPSYEIRSISTTTFLESSTNKMVVAGAFFVAVSCISLQVSCLQEVVDPAILGFSCASVRKRILTVLATCW